MRATTSCWSRAPASGKTIAAGAALPDAMRARECDQLIVVCPTVIVRDQWAAELGRLGYRMRKQFSRHHGGWPDSAHGMCATYAQIAARPGAYARACRERRTVVVLDEIHHAADRQAWGQAIRTAFEDAQLRLAMSGTPFRSDRDRIPFVTYRGGRCVADYSYSYAQAVRDGLCRRVVFRAHRGVVSWIDESTGEERSAGLAQRVSADEQARRLRRALDPTKPYLRALLSAACKDLQALRDSGVPAAGGLAICANQAHAREVAAVIAELTGRHPVLAISDNPIAHRAIHTFATGQQPWLVAVQMVAEGVDIPRLSVIAWATAARTELMVRQVVGRALRTGNIADRPAVVHMPADAQLIEHAEKLHTAGGDVVRGPAGPSRGAAGGRRGGRGFGVAMTSALDAQPSRAGGPRTITPPLPKTIGVQPSAPVRIVVPPPRAADDLEDLDVELTSVGATSALAIAPTPPPAPARQALRDDARNELYRLVCSYAQLRRAIDPDYPLAAAQTELRERMGVPSRDEATNAEIADATAWVRGELERLAREHPAAVVELARTRRRLRAA